MREARPGLAGGAAGGASVLGESIALEESVAPVIPASPNANAQVDLDGDCVADLVLQAPPHGSTSCEAAACRLLVWLQKPEPGSPRWSVAPDLNESLPVGAGQLGLADMDSDGAMDLVFTSTDTQAHLWLHIWYAVLGASGWDPQVSSALSECGFKPTPPASLCTRRPYLTFFKRQWGMPAGWVMAQTGDRPPTLSLADFDLNSFPDALMPLHAPADAPAPCEPDAPCVLLLYNDERMRCAGLPAAGGSGGEESISRLRLYTESTSSSYPPPADERLFAMLAGASGAAFFDVYDDGVWDVIAMHPHGAVSVWHRASAGGSYFLRATTTDGACAPDALAGVPGESNGWPDEDARDGRSGQCVARGDGGGAFGAWASKPLLHQAGVTYQFETSLPPQWSLMSASSVWSWNRRKQACVAVQLPQGGYAPLQPPFVLVGLGLTNDYVERLMVGMPSGRVRRFDQAVLPNSRLTITPTPLDAPAAWEMELYLAPMQQLAVALVCTALLLLLGAIIAVLEVVERVHDFRENKALRPALPL